MNCCQLIALLLVGLVAATSALDLSHATNLPADVDSRVLSVINDFYAQLVYPALNQVVTSRARCSGLGQCEGERRSRSSWPNSPPERERSSRLLRRPVEQRYPTTD
jgi:hypothetical protein